MTTLFQQLTLAVLLVVLTLAVECAGVAMIIEWLRTDAMKENIRKLSMSRSAVLVMETTIAIIVLQAFVILLWAGCYRWLCFSSWESAFYFSAASYSTVGYGDVLLPPHWHLLGPLESMIGVLMCGISVSLLFALINRLIEHEVQVQAVKA